MISDLTVEEFKSMTSRQYMEYTWRVFLEARGFTEAEAKKYIYAIA